MNIGIDIDDTMSYTFEKVFPIAKEYVKRLFGKEIENEDYTQVDSYNYIETVLGLDGKDIENFWRENLVNLFKTVEPKENVSQVINKLKDEGHKIIIITARWNEEYCNSENLSKEWLKKHNIPYDKIYIGAESKKEIAVQEKLDLFIDDSIKNCREITNENIKCLLFASKVNLKNEESKNFEIVKSWDDIYRKISEEVI